MKRALLTAALLLALPAAAVADEGAQQPPRPRDLAPEARLQQRMDRMAEFLKLTDAQKASIKALHERQQAGAKARHETVQAAAKAFREAVQDPKISTDQLRRLHQAVADARFEALASRRAMMLDVRNLLTPEQREKAAVLRGMGMERRREHRMMMRGERGPGAGPGMGPGRGPGRRGQGFGGGQGPGGGFDE
ncbi:MAG: Spy/CpxP family protein refolding chaperone [Holophagaceae bacterium]